MRYSPFVFSHSHYSVTHSCCRGLLSGGSERMRCGDGSVLVTSAVITLLSAGGGIAPLRCHHPAYLIFPFPPLLPRHTDVQSHCCSCCCLPSSLHLGAKAHLVSLLYSILFLFLLSGSLSFVPVLQSSLLLSIFTLVSTFSIYIPPL